MKHMLIRRAGDEADAAFESVDFAPTPEPDGWVATFGGSVIGPRDGAEHVRKLVSRVREGLVRCRRRTRGARR